MSGDEGAAWRGQEGWALLAEPVRCFEWDRARTLAGAWLSAAGLSVQSLPTQAAWLTLRLELGAEGAATLLSRVRPDGPRGTPFLEFVDVSPQLRCWLAEVVARRQGACTGVGSAAALV